MQGMRIAMIAYLNILCHFQTIPDLRLTYAGEHMFPDDEKSDRHIFLLNDVKHVLCAFVWAIVEGEIDLLFLFLRFGSSYHRWCFYNGFTGILNHGEVHQLDFLAAV